MRKGMCLTWNDDGTARILMWLFVTLFAHSFSFSFGGKRNCIIIHPACHGSENWLTNFQIKFLLFHHHILRTRNVKIYIFAGNLRLQRLFRCHIDFFYFFADQICLDINAFECCTLHTVCARIGFLPIAFFFAWMAKAKLECTRTQIRVV